MSEVAEVGAKPVKGNDKCPLCGGKWNDKKHKRDQKKDKCPNDNACGKKARCAGSNNGSSTKLGRAVSRDSKIRKKHHPLYYKGKSIQAHHLICSEAMNSDRWGKVCQVTGYNINCCKNGVYLPYELELACKVKVPLHRGEHDAGYGGSEIYPNAVKKKINDILGEYTNPKICDDDAKLKKFVDKLNAKSMEIFNYVKNFTWTITWDGFDYQNLNPIGCGNRTSIRDKNGTLKNKSEYSDVEKSEQAVFGKVREIASQQALQRIKTVETIESVRQNQQGIIDQLEDEEKETHKDIICQCKRKHKNIHRNFNKIKIPGLYNLQISK